MLADERPLPSQITDMRSNSVSKQAQQPLLRFRIMPRGVRLSAGQSVPRLRASKTEEKNGKFDSTKGAHVPGLGALAIALWAQFSIAEIASEARMRAENFGSCMVFHHQG